MKKIFNFITTGCSFTAGVIPLPHNTTTDWEVKGSVWPHHCFAKMNPETSNFLNLALPGGGNMAATTNLIYYLETNLSRLDPEKTLIGLNISGLDRVDTMVNNHSNLANKNFCCIDPIGQTHFSDQFGFGWHTKGTSGELSQTIYAHIFNSLLVIECFAYLERHNFNYFFMLLNNAVYDYAPEWFQQALDLRNDSWIKFDGTYGMYEFAQQGAWLDHSGHPTIQGHKLIADYVMRHIKKNNLYHE